MVQVGAVCSNYQGRWLGGGGRGELVEGGGEYQQVAGQPPFPSSPLSPLGCARTGDCNELGAEAGWPFGFFFKQRRKKPLGVKYFRFVMTIFFFNVKKTISC